MEIFDIYVPFRIVWMVVSLLLALALILFSNAANNYIDLSKSYNQIVNKRNRDNPVKILYLRGFDSDGLIINNINMPLNFSSRRVRYDDYEAFLAKKFEDLGHFIAVGIGRHAQEIIGADRIILKDDEWEGEIIKLMDNASMIILRPALSNGLTWEINQLVELNYLYKVVICSSPKEHKKSFYNKFKNQLKVLLPDLPDFDQFKPYIYFNNQGLAFLSKEIVEVPLYKQLSPNKNKLGENEAGETASDSLPIRWFIFVFASAGLLYMFGFFYESMFVLILIVFFVLANLKPKA